MGIHRSKKEIGQGIVEYALIMVLISLVTIGGMSAAGVSIRDVYQDVVDAFNGSGTTQALRNFYTNTFDENMDGWNEAKWGWYFGGRWRAQDGKLKSDRFAATFLDDLEQDDYTVTASGVSFDNAKKTWQGGLLYFRTDPDARTGYVFEIEKRNNGHDAEIYFRKWSNGYQLDPPLASAPIPAGYDFENPTDIQVQVSGDTFTAFMDGEEVLQTSDSTYSSGTVGLASNWGSRMEVDDISIDENPQQ